MALTEQQERDTHMQATEACTRALLTCEANDHSVTSLSGHPLALAPMHPPLDSSGSADAIRGWNDCMAFLHAYHDEQVHQVHSPADNLKAMMFDAMEYERCLSVGAEHYRGAANNIVRLKLAPPVSKGVSSVQEQLVAQLSQLTRDALSVQPAHSSKPLSSNMSQHPAVQRLAQTFVQLQTSFRECKSDQHTFAQLCLSVLALLEAEYDLQAEGVVASNALDQHKEQSGDGSAMEGSSEQTEGQSSDGVVEEPEHSPSQVLTIESNEQAELDNFHAMDDAASVSSTSSELAARSIEVGSTYRAYTKGEDEIVDAADLELLQDIKIYRKQLDAFISKQGSVVNRLSARLRQLLLAQQRSSWAFDQEEGMLDTSRLYRVVTSPAHPLTFKVENESLFKDTTVTLLIDNSKSMANKPIATAAACADILAQTLERCGVSVEILGFTTTELHGSKSLEKWQREGSEESPGRMNGLRHIIYKSASVPFRRAADNVAAMLDRQLLKQNIDGEALLWAYDRIRVRPSSRKILMVISDGAPLDASTLTANPKDYLVTHLRNSIAKVQGDKQIELCAIGINHDVTHYYANAISIHDARDLGKALLAQLSELFKR